MNIAESDNYLRGILPIQRLSWIWIFTSDLHLPLSHILAITKEAVKENKEEWESRRSWKKRKLLKHKSEAIACCFSSFFFWFCYLPISMSGVYFYVGLVVLSLLSVSSVVTSDYSLGSRRSILRAVKNNDNNGDLRDYAVDLNATNFDDVLKDTPATFAVVEFFAHWSVSNPM
ncbi:hypothetical protein K1719_047515 [Acacia pycnantha]|nr:hypothetical protein K1719_047515 [Acacia pycnantha]